MSKARLLAPEEMIHEDSNPMDDPGSPNDPHSKDEQQNEKKPEEPKAPPANPMHELEGEEIHGGVARPLGRPTVPSEEHRGRLRGTAAMDPNTRKEVARKGGLAVSRNRQHMAEIGRKGGQSVSKNREHMAAIGRKGGAASRGHRS